VLVPVIEADGVGTLQPRHVGNQIGVGRFELQVVMVAHQAVGVNLPIRFLARFRQRFEKILPVHILQENSLAPVALAHDVRHRRRILDSHLAWHQAISCGMPPHKSSLNQSFLWTDPFDDRVICAANWFCQGMDGSMGWLDLNPLKFTGTAAAGISLKVDANSLLPPPPARGVANGCVFRRRLLHRRKVRDARIISVAQAGA
jgi:hypothetical protein